MNLSENLREPIRNRDKSTKMDMLVQFMSREKVSTVYVNEFDVEGRRKVMGPPRNNCRDVLVRVFLSSQI